MIPLLIYQVSLFHLCVSVDFILPEIMSPSVMSCVMVYVTHDVSTAGNAKKGEKQEKKTKM